MRGCRHAVGVGDTDNVRSTLSQSESPTIHTSFTMEMGIIP